MTETTFHNTGYHLRVTRSLDDIDPMGWDTLLHPEDYFTYSYLKALANSQLACEFLYAVAECQHKPVAMSFGFFMQFPVWKNISTKVWFGGSPVNVGIPFACHPAVSAAKVFYDLQVALFEAAQAASATCLMWRDFPDGNALMHDSGLAAHLQLSYVPLFSWAILDVQWPDFPSYLGALPASHRKRIRRDIKTVQQADYMLQICDGREVQAQELLPLWLNVYNKYRDEDQIRLTERYFHEMAQQQHAIFFLLRQHTKLVAFDLCFALGQTLESQYCGVDYAATGSMPVQRYVGHEIVRYAIAKGYKTINFGISNVETKRRAGSRFVMIHGYTRPTSSWVNRVGGRWLLTRLLKSDTEKSPSPRHAQPSSPQRVVASLKQPTAEVLVIGAGLGGLAAAAALSRANTPVTVLERSVHIGGVCSTRAFDGIKGHIVGCNLFPRRFFQIMEQAFAIRLPYCHAEVLTYYQNVRFDSRLASYMQGLRQCGLHTGDLLVSGYRIAAARLRKKVWGNASYADVVHYVAGQHAVLKDILFQPANLLSVHPNNLSAGTFFRLLAKAGEMVYPTPGIQAIPQSLARVIVQGPGSEIVLNTTVERILVAGRRVQGVVANGRFLAAKTVISNLPYPATVALIDPPEIREATQAYLPNYRSGLSVAAILLVLHAHVSLPYGYHTFSFVAPNLLEQLTQLQQGRLPDDVSFDLIVPDRLDSGKKLSQVRATIYLNWPAGYHNGPEPIWQKIVATLEQHFPGFATHVIWKKILLPVDYPVEVGFHSIPSPVVEDISYRRPGCHVGAIEGLYNVGSTVMPEGSDSLSALLSGIACVKQAHSAQPWSS